MRRASLTRQASTRFVGSAVNIGGDNDSSMQNILLETDLVPNSWSVDDSSKLFLPSSRVAEQRE